MVSQDQYADFAITRARPVFLPDHHRHTTPGSLEVAVQMSMEMGLSGCSVPPHMSALSLINSVGENVGTGGRRSQDDDG